MKIIIYLLTIFLLPAFHYGQEKLVIKGQVTDAATHEPLTDCHVYVSCRHFGTISDSKGNFILEVPTGCMTQCLIISYVGYEKYIFPVHDISMGKLDIQLEDGAIALAEIIITPDYYKVIYQSEFEPYSQNNLDVHMANDEYIQAMSQMKLAKLTTMF